MASSDEFAPAAWTEKAVQSFNSCFPALKASLRLRTSAAVVVTFADIHNGVVFLKHGAEMVLGDVHAVFTYDGILCGACRIQHKMDSDARRRPCAHLTHEEKFSRVVLRLLRTIDRKTRKK